MKIAILTHPLGTNYGGILQNYALQHVLKQMGHTPVTFDYQFRSSWKTKILSMVKRLCLCLRGKNVPIRVWTTKKESAFISQNTRRFINEYINVTEPFLIDELNRQNHANIDAIVVGSDQVWRGKHPEVSRFFLCDFEKTDVLKIAYAASFGVDYWEFSDEETKKCRMLIKQFKAISVREQGGVNLCEKNLLVTPQLVLDPTLLLTSSDYERLVGKRCSFEPACNYLMTYVLDKTLDKQNIIDKTSMILGLHDKKTVMANDYFSEVGCSNIANCIYPPVESWIQGFMNAKFVVTDSFHGTVFSIIFHKPFIAIANKNRGTDRFVSLLTMLGLKDRLVESERDLDSVIYQAIDYNLVDEKLEKMKCFSLKFLKDNLQ